MISPYSVPPFLNAVLFSLLGIYVYVKRRGSPGNKAYAIWCYFTVHWQLSWAVIYSLKGNLGLAETLTRVGYSGIIFLPIAFYHFAVSFLGLKRETRRMRWIYFVGVCFLATTWMGPWFVQGCYAYTWGYYPHVGKLHPLYLLFLVYLCVHGLQLLAQEMGREEQPSVRRAQIKYVFVASVVYMMACVDFLANYGIGLYPFGYVFTLTSLGLVVYAMMKHHLMDVEIVIRQTVIYSVLTAVVATMMIFITLLFARVTESFLGHQTFYTFTVTACLIAIVFRPLQLKIEYLVDRHLFSGWKDRPMAREIAAGFSHELKSPLAKLSMQAQLSLLELEDLEKKRSWAGLPRIKEQLRNLVRQTQEAAGRVEAVRGVAEPMAGQVEAIEVAAVVENSLRGLQSLIEDSNAHVGHELPKGLPPVLSNAKQLDIVFTNLLKNSLEAMKNAPQRRLSIRGSENRGSVFISIRDTGPGIKSENLERLFQAYFTTKGSKGTGMGLYLSRQIVEAHGGAIEVRSEVGKGTEFIVRLPRYSAAVSG